MKMETLSSLRRLNLGQNETNSKKELAKKEEKKVKVNDEYERYMDEWDSYDPPYNPPALHIIDKSKTVEITLSVQRNAFVQATIEDKISYCRRVGCSTGNITNIFDRVRNIELQDWNDLLYKKSVLFYGFICEALCRAGIPIDPVIADLDMLERFVSESVEFCFHDTENDCIGKMTKLPSTLEIEQVDFIPEDKGRKFILPNKAIIFLSFDSNFYIKISDSEIYKLRRPFFPYSDYHADADADIAAVWILLESLGFYVDEILYRKDNNVDFQIPLSEFDNAKIITPSAIRGELCHVQAWLDYREKERKNRKIWEEAHKK